MTKLKLGISAIVVAGAATTLVIQHQAQSKLTDENQLLRQQMEQLQTANEQLSNLVAQTTSSPSRSDDQLIELLKLRGEVRLLREQTNGLGKLRAAQANATKNQQQSEAAMTAEKQQAPAMMKINSAQQGVLAFIMFADDNKQQFPTNFAQASRYLKGAYIEQIETNFDILYQGSITKIANPSATIVLKEKQAWQASNGKWTKTYAFADGHVEVHTEPDGNFDAYEQQHIVALPPNQ